MVEKYGESFAKQVKESEDVLQQMGDSKTGTGNDKTAVKQPQAESAPEREVVADGDASNASEEQETPAELLSSAELLIKTKRTVDAKVERSRKEISNMRRKMARIDSNLRKRRERERKRYERDLEASRRNCNRNTHDIFGNNIEVRPMKDITLSTMDRNTISHSQQRIAQYKAAIPQLIAFSQELTTNIDTSAKRLGSVKSAIINNYEENVPDTIGPETEPNPYDTMEANSFGL